MQENDETTTLAELKRKITAFVDERDWQQFHDPKNLVMALTSEVGELADIFRWVPSDESLELATSSEHKQAVAHELADVMMFALELASVCKIDLAEAIETKSRINAGKYPIEKSKGSSRKYNQL
jgi:NTP pyrophosphatase (non-canonical NTP hydrolase)